MYSKKVVRHFKNPKFAGDFKAPDAVGEVGNIRCGDIMKIFLKIDKNIVKDIKFLTYGCVAAIACADVVCSLSKGKTLASAARITHKDIIKELGELPPIKHHCSVLAITALKKAIEAYKSKI